eukprot:622793-Pleurochrysis_carterae.AAC.1
MLDAVEMPTSPQTHVQSPSLRTIADSPTQVEISDADRKMRKTVRYPTISGRCNSMQTWPSVT